MSDLLYKLNLLKKQKNVVILSHYYTTKEVQSVADYVGDSLALSEKAANTDADIILFAGVRFMAETAKILSPQKHVLLVDSNAGCSLADSCPKEDFERFLKNYPGHTVISYVNTSSEIKTLSDIIVTSSNAVQIVGALPKNERIVFGPDRNLGNYVAKQTGRDMVIWDGGCHLHHQFTTKSIEKALSCHPDAKVIAHPECPNAVLDMAEYVGSTAALLKYVKQSQHDSFIVATENGILYQMQHDCPEKHFFTVNSSCCQYMKMNTIEKMITSLETMQEEIFLDENTIKKAYKPIEKMLTMSKSLGLL